MLSCKVWEATGTGRTKYVLYVNGEKMDIYYDKAEAKAEAKRLEAEEVKRLPKISAEEFCRYFNFSFRKKEGRNEYGEYSYIAEDDQGMFDSCYVNSPTELPGQLESLFVEFVDVNLEERGFSYTTGTDLILPTYYEQAQGWIETSCRELIGTTLYKVVCALATGGMTITE